MSNSVDTKKKELVGDFKNRGKQWRPKRTPDLVRVHDFIIPEKGKAIPYGVCDLTRNRGIGAAATPNLGSPQRMKDLGDLADARESIAAVVAGVEGVVTVRRPIEKGHCSVLTEPVFRE